MSAALTLVGHGGEVVEVIDAHALLRAAGIYNVAEASLLDVAAVDEQLVELAGVAKEARGLVNTRAVELLDREASWTQRVGPYEVKAPSPTAGTTTYETSALLDVVNLLVVDGIISQAAADAALEPSVPLVPLSYEVIRQIVSALQGEADQADHEHLVYSLESLIAFEPEPTYSQRPAGIGALLKLPAASAAILACQRSVDPPRRVARVRRVTP